MEISLFLILFFASTRLIYSKSRAVIYCVNNERVQSALSSVEALRTVFHVKTEVAVAHCDELSQANKALLSFYKITILNVCPETSHHILGMSIDKARKRLHSWWCKPAAAIIAPYDEVMIVDLDVIFFKNPEILFTAKGIEYIARSIGYIVLSLAYCCLPYMVNIYD